MDYRNAKTEEVISLDLTHAQVVQKFLETAPQDNWLWFWLARHAQDQLTAIPAVKDMIAFLADSFLLAIGMGLKHPMIRLHHNQRRFKIYLSAKGTLCFKSGALAEGTNDPIGGEVYMGCLYSGKFMTPRERKVLLPAEQEFIDRMSADPVNFMAKASKDMSRCCYCNLPLEDARSKEVGYGATCAWRWGLPWGKSYDDKVPSFAQMWANAGHDEKRNVRGMCAAVRANPKDEHLWAVLGDALEEAGYTKKPKAPTGQFRVPAV